MSDWKQDLDEFFRARGLAPRPSDSAPRVRALVRRDEEAATFIAETVMPAFEELQEVLSQYGRVAQVGPVQLSPTQRKRAAASIRVRAEGRDEFEYIIGVRVTLEQAFPYVELIQRWPWYARERMIREGAQDYSVTDITKEEVIRHFLSSYKAHLAP
jgi:hypothetical protein